MGAKNDSLNPVHRLLWPLLVASLLACAQTAQDADELLQKAQSTAESIKSWRAEVIQKTRISAPGIDLKSEVATKFAAQSPLLLNRQNSGDDKTTIVCDGAHLFYSGDGHSFQRSDATVSPQCNFPLSSFYKSENLENTAATAAIVGHDHVRLSDGDRPCVLVHAEWKLDKGSNIHTLCIDPASALILRDVAEIKDEKSGARAITTTLFTSFETNPTFPPDTFKFSIPPGAVEAHPPI